MIKRRIKVIIISFIVILALLVGILVINGFISYKHHERNQKYIHPKDVTTWFCKEIDMTITYDNERETSSFCGEIILNGESTNLSIGIIGTSDTMDFYNAEDFNNSDFWSKKLFSGEFNFVNEKEFELKITDNKFLPNDITKITFIER